MWGKTIVLLVCNAHTSLGFQASTLLLSYGSKFIVPRFICPGTGKRKHHVLR